MNLAGSEALGYVRASDTQNEPGSEKECAMIETLMIHLRWRRFDRMTKACKASRAVSCVYVIADPKGKPLYIGCSEDLDGRRYRGGTASAFDAALHGSGNLILVAEITPEHREAVEKALIWAEKPPYNRQGKIIPLSDFKAGTFTHEGDVPAFGLGLNGRGHR